MLVFPDGRTLGTIGGGEVEYRVVAESLDALKEGKTRLVEYNLSNPEDGDPAVCGGQLMVYIEPILPRNKLVIIGGGHVGKEVAHLAHWLGFHVTVCDDRPEFCSPESVPYADEYLTDGLPEITPWTYAALTTRKVEIDLLHLPVLLNSKAAYIGVIGSQRRWEITKKSLLESGIPQEKIDIIHSPIGLALNAETPREISISIIAEIIMVQKQGDSKPMSVTGRK
jgi:xanthine dehydrogenase accessory factor